MSDIGGIILAAGSSIRFGSDKRRQLIASGETMLEATILKAATVLEALLVVLRADDEDFAHELAAQVGFPEVRYYCAPDSSLGMAHSLANAVEQVREWRAAMVILGDLPFILPSTYQALVNAYDGAALSTPIILPRYHGRQGHPVLFDRSYFPEISALQGDVGARSIVRAHANKVIDLEVEDPGILQDIDRPEDLPA